MPDDVATKLDGKTLSSWALVPCEIGADSHLVFRFGVGSAARYVVLCCKMGEAKEASELKCPVCGSPLQYGSGFIALSFDDLPIVQMRHYMGGGKLPVKCPHCGAIHQMTPEQAVLRHAWRCRRCHKFLGRADFSPE